MKIVIAGDLVPINSNKNLFNVENLNDFFIGFQSIFDNSDLFIANLECPITHSENKTIKSGSSIKANPENLLGIKKMNINLLSLANNHIGDYGDEGIEDSLRVLRTYGLNFLGVGKNLEHARKPYIHKAKGKKVGVLSYADFEFGMAEVNSCGANPYDSINAYQDITKLKFHTDYIIVLLHDGKEYYPYPSPELQKIGRYLIDLGANLVVCQHSHIIGATEYYNSGTIVYGQGNFLFDYRGNRSKEWSEGMLICLDLENEEKLDFVPFKQNYPGIKSLNVEEKKTFEKNFKSLNQNVNDNFFIQRSWDELIKKQSKVYLSNAFGHNLIISKLLKKTGLFKYVVSRKIALIVLNFIRSRVHREIFIGVLKNRTTIEK